MSMISAPPGRRPGLMALKIALLLGLASVPCLWIAGFVTLFANPCFYRQFPQRGCPQASLLPGSAGWVLIWSGCAVLGVIMVAGLIAKGAGKPTSPGE